MEERDATNKQKADICICIKHIFDILRREEKSWAKEEGITANQKSFFLRSWQF